MLAFNRPAILELVANDGQRVSVLLREVRDENADVIVAGEGITVSRQQIDQHWYGAYVLLWKPPLGTGTLRVGDRGPNVEWLRHRIDQEVAGGRPVSSSDPTLFDAELEQRVRQFQAQHSLHQDGVAGSETLIYLNSLDDPGNIPLLQATPG
jgi:general secretion pathway protein A